MTNRLQKGYHLRIVHCLLMCYLLQWTSAFLPSTSRTRGTPSIQPTFHSVPTTPLPAKNWDEILKQEEGGDDADENSQRQIARDMLYNERNCRRGHETFLALKTAQAPGADVYGYCQDSTDDKEGVFWYLGKVNSVSDVSLQECVSRQWDLISHHAANLRPLDLFSAVTNQKLQLWTTKLDSELDVAYNRPHTIFQKMERDVEGADTIKTNLIGFSGEYYENGEDGFRTFRHPQTGAPTRPELKGPQTTQDNETSSDASETRALTEEEMQRLRKALDKQNMSISDLYEEQERRKPSNS